jgi:hypothetical protein
MDEPITKVEVPTLAQLTAATPVSDRAKAKATKADRDRLARIRGQKRGRL